MLIYGSAHRSQDPSCSAAPLTPPDPGYLAQQHPAGLQEDVLPSVPPSGSLVEPGWRAVPTQMGHTLLKLSFFLPSCRATSSVASADSRAQSWLLTFSRQEQFVLRTVDNEDTRGC